MGGVVGAPCRYSEASFLHRKPPKGAFIRTETHEAPYLSIHSQIQDTNARAHKHERKGGRKMSGQYGFVAHVLLHQ